MKSNVFDSFPLDCDAFQNGLQSPFRAFQKSQLNRVKERDLSTHDEMCLHNDFLRDAQNKWKKSQSVRSRKE